MRNSTEWSEEASTTTLPGVDSELRAIEVFG
jgi:hypothetical protein